MYIYIYTEYIHSRNRTSHYGDQKGTLISRSTRIYRSLGALAVLIRFTELANLAIDDFVLAEDRAP